MGSEMCIRDRFNIADCAVTLGTISLMAYLLFDIFKKENKDEPAN